MFTGAADLGRIAHEYFSNLFTPPQSPDYNSVTNFVKPLVNAEDNDLLLRPFEISKFKDAIF